MECFYRSIAGILVLCLAALTAVGCGGGSGETDSEALSRAQYVKQADAICEKQNNHQEALLKKEVENQPASSGPSKAEQEAFVVNAGLPPLREEARQLDELGAPEGEEEKAKALVDALRKAIKEAEADPITLVEAKSSAFEPAEQVAKELGLEVCGGP